MGAKDIIRRHEGLRLNAYRCPSGVWTIGYGHTAGVASGDYVTVDEAERMLAADVAQVRESVMALALEAEVELAEHQMEALVSFAFNVGIGALRRSTLWRLVKANPGDQAIAAEFARWIHGGGRVLPGLVSRRAEESRLYFFGE